MSLRAYLCGKENYNKHIRLDLIAHHIFCNQVNEKKITENSFVFSKKPYYNLWVSWRCHNRVEKLVKRNLYEDKDQTKFYIKALAKIWRLTRGKQPLKGMLYKSCLTIFACLGQPNDTLTITMIIVFIYSYARKFVDLGCLDNIAYKQYIH